MKKVVKLYCLDINEFKDPFELKLKDNYLYGLGACDMKGGIAAMLDAVSNIDFSKLKYGMKLYFTFDEETWRWTYSGADLKLDDRMITSANPYEFKADGFRSVYALIATFMWMCTIIFSKEYMHHYG